MANLKFLTKVRVELSHHPTESGGFVYGIDGVEDTRDLLKRFLKFMFSI